MKVMEREKNTVLMTKRKDPEPREKSHLRKVADAYSMNYDTLKDKSQRNPGVPLEELAAEGVMSRSEIGRSGSRVWRQKVRKDCITS